MRTLLQALLLFAALPAGAEQLPFRLDYQGRLLDSSGVPREGTALLNFRLYGAPSGGSALWSETHDPVPLVNGFFAVQLGSYTALNAGLFAGASAYLEVDVDPAGAEGLETLWPRRLLAMAPWAHTASSLVSSSSLRVMADASTATFASNGDLLLSYGLEAGTGTFTGSVTASSGSFTASGAGQYSLQASSGLRSAAGTVLAEGGGGVRATYGVRSTTAVFYGTGDAVYSLSASSGILVSAGTLWIEGGGGVLARYGVSAATGVFTGAGSGGYGVDASSGVRVALGSLQVGASPSRTLSDRNSDGSLLISSNAVVGGSVSARNFDWVFLGSATVETPATNFTVNIRGEDYLFLYLQIVVSGVSASCIVQLRFNGDSGANYSSQISDDAGFRTNRTSQTALHLQEAGDSYQGFFNVVLNNNPSTGNNLYWNGGRGSAISVASHFYNGGGYWASTGWTTSITVLNDSAAEFSTDTSIRVFGMR